MSIIGSFVGALVALGFRAKPEKKDQRADELARERAYIVHLESELIAERERARLWRNEALRLRHERPLPLGGQHAAAQGDWQQLGQAAQNVMAQQASQLQQMAAYQAAQSQMNWPQDYHCDCSPSRAWGLTGVIPGA